MNSKFVTSIEGTNNEGNVVAVMFVVEEGRDTIELTYPGQPPLNINREHFIRLGLLAKPLTYKEETIPNQYTITKRYE